jgi:peptide/nickel transport system substrate-binding protein
VILNSANAAPNAFNTANFRDPEVDGLLRRQGESSDPKERIDALGQVLRIAGEQLPYAPMVFLDTGLIVSDRYEYEGFNGLYYFQDMAGRLSNA